VNKNIKYNEFVANETIEDYSLRYAPKSFRKWSELQIANTAIGSISFLALEAIGASIAISYGFSTAFWAIFCASLIIFITAVPISYYAAKYNIDIDLITRSAGFGYVGSTFTSLIYASFSFIFFALEAAIMAQALEVYFGLPLGWGYLLSSIIIIPMVFYGFHFISKLQFYTQPLWIIMMIAPYFAILLKEPYAINILSSFQGEISHSSEFNVYYFGFALGISLSLIAQIGEQVDYLRFMPPLTKQNRIKWWCSVLIAGPGWIIIGFLKQMGGIFLMSIALSLGMGIYESKTPIEMYNVGYNFIFSNPELALSMATLFVVISQIKINVTNAYAGSLAWSNFFSRITHSHPGRVVWMVFNIAIALLLMELGLFDVLQKVLGLYSNVAIAWIGAIFADLVINKPLGLSPKIVEFKRAYLYDINPVGVGSMLIASIISILSFMGLFGNWMQSYSSLLALFIAIFLSPLIAYVTKGKYYIARKDRVPNHQIQICGECSHEYESEDMVYCPLVNHNICSLCCTLDSLCHDSCKANTEKTLREKVVFFLANTFHLTQETVYKITDFLLINAILFFLLVITGWMSYSMSSEGLPVAELLRLKEIITTNLVVVGILIMILIFWIILLQDSKKRAEGQLEAQNETLKKQKIEFETFYNDSKDAIGILDMQSNFLVVNPAYCEITGFSEEELLQTSCLRMTHQEDLETSKKAFKEVIEVGYIKNFEKRCFIKNQKIIFVNMSMSLIKNPDRVLISVHDITQQKLMDRTLKEKTQELQKLNHILNERTALLNTMFKSIPLPIFYKDTERVYIGTNEAFDEIYGFEKGYLIGKTVFDIAPQEMAKEYDKKDLFLLNNPNEKQIYNYVIKNFSTGKIHEVVFHKQCYSDDNGNILGIIGAIIDVTKINKIQKELLKAKEIAEDSTKLKSEFLANMSHEIRTPMNGIIGMSHLIIRTNLSTKQKSYMIQIENSAKNLLLIINDILDFSKIEAGKLSIEKVDFDIDMLLESIKSTLLFQAQEKGLKLSIECQCKENNIFYGDPLRISQVLINLIGNSIKFTQKGFVKIIVQKQEKDLVLFTISDSGIGIEDEKQRNLFAPFSQADGSITREYGGTGLGLSISKQLVGLMDGKIWFKSKIGEGSQFFVALPLPKGESKNIEKKYIDFNSIGELSGSNILLVEDNMTNQKIIRGLLEESGINIDVANNGQEAIDLVENFKEKYDLIFMDIQMPVMDGFEATKHIKVINADIPIIALSANAMKEDADKTKEAGMQEHLNKPIEVDKLYNVLLKYIIKNKEQKSSFKIIIEDTEEFPCFQNIDSKKGLHHMMGNKKLYFKILKDFYENYRDLNFDELDKESLKRTLHSLKGLSANIGAIELHNTIKEIENRDNKSLESDFYQALHSVLNELEFLQKNYEPHIVTKTISQDTKVEIVQATKEFAKKRRAKQIKQLLHKAYTYKLSQKDQELFDTIHKSLNKRDYTKILEIIDEYQF